MGLYSDSEYPVPKLLDELHREPRPVTRAGPAQISSEERRRPDHQHCERRCEERERTAARGRNRRRAEAEGRHEAIPGSSRE